MRECKSIEEVRENIDKLDNQIGERPLPTHWATPFAFLEEGDFCRNTLN
ncbi:hypothetical protein [Metabacillus litoralis]|nr:hypothetical protein [Metabacillus litoralis]MCM3653493.1 hypothetical protein [Metabacillus litoralis]